MPTFVGDQTKQALFLNVESHKLHLAFTAGNGTIRKGDQVKIQADGSVIPLAAGDNASLSLGVVIKSGTGKNPAPAGEEVTVAVKGYAVLTAEAGAASVPAGPVKFSAQGTNYQRYIPATDDATTQAINTIPASAVGQVIEIIFL